MVVTEFGLLLSELLAKRGMNIADLCITLSQQGYGATSEDVLTGYMRGKREMDPDSPRFFA